MAELILEIGTEEIPSGYLDKGLEDFREMAEAALMDNRIAISVPIETQGTPRRLLLIGSDIAGKQADGLQEVTGPPRKAAFDQEGNPTKAALGFANKQGVSVQGLEVLETPKGEYLFVRRKIPGRPAKEVLSEILPPLIAGIPWPKSMRWGEGSFSFVRPIHWILALLDGEVIPFQLADIQSGNRSRGHRFMSSGMMEILNLQDYLTKMQGASILVDRNERRAEVQRMVREAAGRVSGIPSLDPELLTTVTNLVELPSAVCGSFDKEFLRIPDPVLVTAMKKHQKYFSVRDAAGNLMPYFVAVNNTVTRDQEVVTRGHERVLRARLADADFFFKEDRKRPLADRLEDLKGVIYQAELGTSYAKVQRFTALGEFLGEQIAPERRDDIRLAAMLCKCDLVTEMVMEFPSLQGVMGREYARLDRHPEEVCLAIAEHYLPTRAGGELPTSLAGAVVGVADRMDTIAGCFAINQEPTGAADPYALRRHALAVIRIMENTGWDVSLEGLIARSLVLLKGVVPFDEGAVFKKVSDFFRERYRNMMLGLGYKGELVEAVISARFDRIAQLRPRMDHLTQFMAESAQFPSLVLTAKRVNNILKNQAASGDVEPNLFKESCEEALWIVFQELRDDVQTFIGQGKFLQALHALIRLQQPVDAFFEGVEILKKDDIRLMENRLGMLQNVSDLFLGLADFSKFAI